LDGHVAIGRHNSEELNKFVWFCESGQRITNVEINRDETKCGLVCWDGSGALFECNDDVWNVTRVFSSSLLLASISRSRMCNPAFGTFCENIWHIYFNGGIKSCDDDGIVKWICREDDCHTGFCRVDEKTMLVVLDVDEFKLIEK
jgi:hypothetical protein